MYDATTGQPRQTLHPIGDDVTGSLAFATDGTLATGTQSGFVQLWNPVSGAQIAGPLPVVAGPISSIAFDPAGRLLATTASQDGTVKLFATSRNGRLQWPQCGRLKWLHLASVS